MWFCHKVYKVFSYYLWNANHAEPQFSNLSINLNKHALTNFKLVLSENINVTQDLLTIIRSFYASLNFYKKFPLRVLTYTEFFSKE